MNSVYGLPVTKTWHCIAVTFSLRDRDFISDMHTFKVVKYFPMTEILSTVT